MTLTEVETLYRLSIGYIERKSLEKRNYAEVIAALKDAGCREAYRDWQGDWYVSINASALHLPEQVKEIIAGFVARTDTEATRIPVGSRVRCIDARSHNAGRDGIVKGYDPTADNRFRVRWDGDRYDLFYTEQDLALI